ncbi:cilia- and flagella-associated protein 61-like [Plodia interpunctella]|uniref:cilia- and flagella-associated protein 61-like n=1 Tax=Plodia interpunctella TaxID=58824 RepID=UPI002367E7E2|nr:cilia- and flagella-associated protein 61-like [Plodia interpunctella]
MAGAGRFYHPPALSRIRFACKDDAPFIMAMINKPMAMTFRIDSISDVNALLENGVLSICQLDINNTIIGFLGIKDYPLIPSIHPGAWEGYIWTKYKTIELNARNTLWIHLLCFNNQYGRDLVDNMLKSVFMHDPYVHYIGMVKTLISYPLLVPGQSRVEGAFRRVTAMERGVPGDQLPTLCIADRVDVSPRLRVRRAVEADNDDIVPIINYQSTRLKEMYGEFYVSELISRHPEYERVLLVCEHKELAVGVMCINTQINFEALEENFELSPFAGLRHHTTVPFQRPSADYESNISTGLLPSISLSMTTTPSELFSINKYDSAMKMKDAKSRVTWTAEDEGFAEGIEAVAQAQAAQAGRQPVSYAASQLEILNLLEDEEEELEFDIINIDTDLLRVPEVLSYRNMEGVADSITNKIAMTAKKKSVDEEKPKNNKTKKNSQAPTFSPTANKTPEPNRYVGAPNAFLLELFAMHPDYDERYGFDILEAAYELFPTRDYCILCLPSNHPSFPLLDHFTLVTPYGNRMRFINETLYVAHVNSVRGTVAVRPGEGHDVEKIVSDILEHAPRPQSLGDLFESTLTSKSLLSFVLLSEKQPIGVIVIGPLTDGAGIRMQYDLDAEPRRAGTDATVVAGVMSPALEPHGRWYMREILRHSQFTTLFWLCRLFAKGDVGPSRNLMSLATHMTPVHPRRTVPNITGNKDLDKLSHDLAVPFALWVLERPLTSMPRVFVNNSIVVVGASRTGLAFLETLIMGATSGYLTFSNVTLVTEHGLPAVAECLKAADTCVPRVGRYTDRYLKSVPFYFYVDVMSAVMINIDRQKKCIRLKGGGVKFYDDLVLTCGQQYQHPEYLCDSLELVKEIEKGKPCERMLMDNPKYQPERVPPPPDIPDNLFLVNSLFEANFNLRKLLKMISEAKDSSRCLSENNQVIVYGDCVEAYSCLAALLELGISASMITFVEPFPPEDSTLMRVNCFNDEMVDSRVQASIKRLGITEFRRCSLVGWCLRNNHVVSIDLMAPLHAIFLPCFALFYYGLKAIDLYAFKAINESGLVYDGGIVVGPQFETNDPHIYAAGTCVRYSRRLYAKRINHKYYSSEDVGEALAKQFLRKVDPFIMCDEPDPKDMLPNASSTVLGFRTSQTGISPSATQFSIGLQRKWQPVMKFESPLMVSATLPGPNYYVKLRKPGPEIPMEVQLTLPHRGHTLVTDKRCNYFRLQVNVLHCVDAVTCLGKKYFSTEILSQLYGKHEALFNQLLARYQMGLIEDFFDFFTQSWMSTIYQETFDRLMMDIAEQDVSKAGELLLSGENPGEKPEDIVGPDVPSGTFIDVLYSLQEKKDLGTFRSVIDNFIAATSRAQIVTVAADIPSECGQSAAVRNAARSFWRTVGGDRIVVAHVAKFLNRNSVTNPQYAAPNPQFY